MGKYLQTRDKLKVKNNIDASFIKVIIEECKQNSNKQIKLRELQ